MWAIYADKKKEDNQDEQEAPKYGTIRSVKSAIMAYQKKTISEHGFDIEKIVKESVHQVSFNR